MFDLTCHNDGAKGSRSHQSPDAGRSLGYESVMSCTPFVSNQMLPLETPLAMEL
jgi:hypothetical protein